MYMYIYKYIYINIYMARHGALRPHARFCGCQSNHGCRLHCDLRGKQSDDPKNNTHARSFSLVSFSCVEFMCCRCCCCLFASCCWRCCRCCWCRCCCCVLVLLLCVLNRLCVRALLRPSMHPCAVWSFVRSMRSCSHLLFYLCAC